MSQEAFNPKDLVLSPELLAKAKRSTAAAPRARTKTISGIKRKDAFAITPLWWARCANAAGDVNYLVCTELLYRAWRVRDGSKTFVMPNCEGVTSKVKLHTLRVLVKAGLIAVDWRDRKSPVVTLTVSPF
jgi:hypothetical protein